MKPRAPCPLLTLLCRCPLVPLTFRPSRLFITIILYYVAQMDLPPIPSRKRSRDSRRHGGGLSSASLRYANEVLLLQGSGSNRHTTSDDFATKQLGRRLAYLLAVLGFIQLAQLFDVSLSSFADILPEALARPVIQHRRSLRMRRQLASSSSTSRPGVSASPPSSSSLSATTADMCPLSHAVQPTTPIQSPVPIASYPGSGAKMTWMLVETLTGLVTADEHRLNGNPWNRAVSVKTHWPHPHGAARIGHVVDQNLSAGEMATGVLVTTSTTDAEDTDGVSFPRAVLLLRHPLSAIPSLHNYLYEAQTQTRGHTVRAPLDRWRTWLERNFDAELAAWEHHLVYWMDHYGGGAGVRLVVTFEGLTDEVEGPRSSVALMDFLSLGVDDNNEGVGWTPRTDDEVACIWNKMVQYKKEGSGHENGPASANNVPPGNDRILFNPNQPISHRSGSDYRPYTQDQLGRMADMFRRLQGRFGGDEQVAPILEAYLQRVWRPLRRPLRLQPLNNKQSSIFYQLIFYP